MRAILQVLMSVLILMAALPAVAASGGPKPTEGFQPAVLSSEGAPNTSNIQHLTLGQAAAMIGGAIIGGTVGNLLLSGTLFTIIGGVIGATLGSEWYDRGMWPFAQ
jgi:hypothetical protein